MLKKKLAIMPSMLVLGLFTLVVSSSFKSVICEIVDSKQINAALLLPQDTNKNARATDVKSVVTCEKPLQTEPYVICIVPDENPTFQGGDLAKFSEWVSKNHTYPAFAKKNGISGKVFAQFVVSPEGKLVDIKILRGVHPSLNNEVLRILALSPLWKSGKKNGKEVFVQFVIPVIFNLK